MAELKVGAVSYHPRVVTIWERFRTYFADAGLPTDYVLYSNYESLVEAVLAGEVDIGWNTNTAYVTLDHRAGGRTRILGMRDVDQDWATVLVMRRGESIDEPAELNGRTLALGSSDSGHAAILPLHYLAEHGLHAERDCELLRFDTDLGKHGDTGDFKSVAEGANVSYEAASGPRARTPTNVDVGLRWTRVSRRGWWVGVLAFMVVVLGRGGRRATATTTGHSEMRGSGPQDSVRSWGASH